MAELGFGAPEAQAQQVRGSGRDHVLRGGAPPDVLLEGLGAQLYRGHLSLLSGISRAWPSAAAKIMDGTVQQRKETLYMLEPRPGWE